MVDKLQEINSKVTAEKAMELLEESEFDLDSWVLALLDAQADIEKENPDPSAPRLSGLVGVGSPSQLYPPTYMQQPALASQPMQQPSYSTPYLQPPMQQPNPYTVTSQPQSASGAYAVPLQPGQYAPMQMQPLHMRPLQYVGAPTQPMQPGYVSVPMQYVAQPQGQKPQNQLYAPNQLGGS